MANTHTTIHGNLTREPELSYPTVKGEGRAMAKFGVAVSNRRLVNGEWVDGDPDYFDCVVWGPLAEHVVASVTKGDRVLIDADARYSSWKVTDDNGEEKNRSKIEFSVNAIGPSLQFAEIADNGIVKANGKGAATKTGSSLTEDF